MHATDTVHTRIPLRELERRWRLVRERLKAKNLQALVVFNGEDFLGAHVKWLTDRPVIHAYWAGVVFHADDLMSVIEHGPSGARRALDGTVQDYPGVGEVLTTAAFVSANYTNTYEAEIVVKLIKARGYKRVALAGTGAMTYAFVNYLYENAGVEWVDETDYIDQLKAIKSADEIAEIKKTARMQDIVFEKILPKIKPGLRDMDVMALAQYEGRLLGSEQAVFMFGSQPMGKPTRGSHPHYQGRMLNKGDQISILLENNGPAGFYTELGRTVVLGRGSNALHEACAGSREAQAHTVAQFKPGALAADIARRHDAYMAERGMGPERRLYAHAQGYALVERPLIRADEPMALAKDMAMVCHPGYPTKDAQGYICDNYMIEEHGPGPCLHQTEKKVFELD